MASPTQPRNLAQRSPLRVCHIAYSFYESDNRVRRYAEALAERGDHVDVIALRRPGQSSRDEQRGVHICRVQRRELTEGGPVSYAAKILFFLLRAAALVSARHLRRRYDVLHIHNVPDFLVFASWLPKLTGAGIVLDIHDILPELYADKFGTPRDSRTFAWLRWIERRSVQFADHVIVAGELWRRRLIGRTGIAPERCTSMLNYPDRNLFKPLDTRERRADGRFIVLYPGSLNHHQGVDIAIRAFALLGDQMPDAELHIYGAGPAKPVLAALAHTLQLDGKVSLKPPLPLNEIVSVMAGADLGVIPKRAEGFGNEAFSTKSLEFMACGIPVVMSRTHVDSEFFDESLVRFFESGSADSLAEAILAEYRCTESRCARASRAASFVATMDWSTKRSNYLNIVDGVARG